MVEKTLGILLMLEFSLLCHSTSPAAHVIDYVESSISCKGMWGERNLWVAGCRTGIYARRLKNKDI